MRWLFAALLVLQAHFAASYLVPLDREAQTTFGGLLSGPIRKYFDAQYRSCRVEKDKDSVENLIA